jgi:hypothetical protein
MQKLYSKDFFPENQYDQYRVHKTGGRCQPYFITQKTESSSFFFCLYAPDTDFVSAHHS